jgi:hypothetical protein
MWYKLAFLVLLPINMIWGTILCGWVVQVGLCLFVKLVVLPLRMDEMNETEKLCAITVML